MMRTFAIKVAYDGTRYAGWQSQKNAVSIQQKIEEATEKALGSRSIVVGSGRTDAGVHASAQIAKFSSDRWAHDPGKLVPALNRRLPSDIVIRSACEVNERFDPVRHAIGKRYRYRIWHAPSDCPFRHRYHWYFPRPIQWSSMQEAAKILVGCHDFAAFQSLGSPRKTTVRTIRELSVKSIPNEEGMDLEIEVEADGFLYNMVRNIVGALVEVGTDRFSSAWISDVLESKDRRRAGMTAPPHGLCLIRVDYPASTWLMGAKTSDERESSFTRAGQGGSHAIVEDEGCESECE